MRFRLSKHLIKSDYFLHADMWNINKFPVDAKVINCGLGESNLLNIAGGIAYNNNTVYIYGVAGFIIHRYEQLKFSCVNYGALKGTIIICNAGKVGYSGLGKGHELDDDLALMQVLNIPTFQPQSASEFEEIIQQLKNKKGIYYIQLGKDE